MTDFDWKAVDQLFKTDIPRWRVLRRIRALELQVRRLEGKLTVTAGFALPESAFRSLWGPLPGLPGRPPELRLVDGGKRGGS
jgi:hypothetical protein